ncbi:hypothetical protein MRX96_035367 [Rhipicephalus microplus]
MHGISYEQANTRLSVAEVSNRGRMLRHRRPLEQPLSLRFSRTAALSTVPFSNGLDEVLFYALPKRKRSPAAEKRESRRSNSDHWGARRDAAVRRHVVLPSQSRAVPAAVRQPPRSARACALGYPCVRVSHGAATTSKQRVATPSKRVTAGHLGVVVDCASHGLMRAQREDTACRVYVCCFFREKRRVRGRNLRSLRLVATTKPSSPVVVERPCNISSSAPLVAHTVPHRHSEFFKDGIDIFGGDTPSGAVEFLFLFGAVAKKKIPANQIDSKPSSALLVWTQPRETSQGSRCQPSQLSIVAHPCAPQLGAVSAAMNGGLYEESRSSLEAPQPLHIPAKRLSYGQADCSADPMAAGGVIRQSPWASPWPGAEAAFEAPHHYQQGVRDSASYFYPAAADRKPFNLWPAAAKGYELGPTAAADACQAYSQAWCPYPTAAAYPAPQAARVVEPSAAAKGNPAHAYKYDSKRDAYM